MLNIKLNSNLSFYDKKSYALSFKQSKPDNIQLNQKKEILKDRYVKNNTSDKILLVLAGGLTAVAGVFLYKQHKYAKLLPEELKKFEDNYGNKAKNTLENIIKDNSDKEKLQIIKKTKENLDRKLAKKESIKCSKEEITSKFVEKHGEQIKRIVLRENSSKTTLNRIRNISSDKNSNYDPDDIQNKFDF